MSAKRYENCPHCGRLIPITSGRFVRHFPTKIQDDAPCAGSGGEPNPWATAPDSEPTADQAVQGPTADALWDVVLPDPLDRAHSEECPHCSKLVLLTREGLFVRHSPDNVAPDATCAGTGLQATSMPYCGNHIRRQRMVPQNDGSYVCPRCGAPSGTANAASDPQPTPSEPHLLVRAMALMAEMQKRLDEIKVESSSEPPPRPAGPAINTLASVEELAVWWHDLAETDLAAVMPKATEYSAYDLIMIGRATAEMLGWSEVDDAMAAEVACWWYLLGKVGRAVGAIREHRLPSQDTGDDVRVYATMIRRIRERGAWPG